MSEETLCVVITALVIALMFAWVPFWSLSVRGAAGYSNDCGRETHRQPRRGRE